MIKKKYVIKKQDLYKSIGNLVNENYILTDQTLFQNQNECQQKMTPRQFMIEHGQESKQNQNPSLNPSQLKFISIRSGNKKSKQKVMSKSKQKSISVLKHKVMNRNAVKKTNVSINFSSSLKNNNQNKVNKSNQKITKKAKSKQKQKQAKQKLKNSIQWVKNQDLKCLNHQDDFFMNRQTQIFNSKYADTKELVKKQLNIQDKKQAYLQKNQLQLIDQGSQVQEHMIFQDNNELIIPNQYLSQFELRLNILQNQLTIKENKIKQLMEFIQAKQQSSKQNENQTIRLYKQNQQLSDMLRDFQIIIENKTNQNQNLLIQAQTKLKQKSNQHKILQAERDTLIRKKDRQNQQITQLHQTIAQKDNQIQQWKEKQQLLKNQNNQIIKAYQKMKSQLQQALKINETQKFFKQLVQKTDQQTKISNFQVQSFRCEKCNQIIYGNENTMDQLAKYHLNEKFQNHIKTYEDQVKYWKDQLHFMKTQHQHQIENIRTILQCTYQKNLYDKETKWYEEIAQLKQKIDIQQQLIQNYKNILEKKTQTTKKLFNKIEMSNDKSPDKDNYQTVRNIEKSNLKNISKDQQSTRLKSDSQRKSHSARLSYCSDLPKNSQLIELINIEMSNTYENSRLFQKDY